MGSRDPQARSSALAALGSLQPRAFGSLNRVDPLDSVSNYYLVVVVCSQWFFMVVMSSQRFLYVLIDSHRLSMVLTGSQ